ncbi:MAG: hypothetical protein H6551_08530 [Chitinophagales bacterium]|nr:hypothetical protein [Chitinophagales bacterium]
MNNLLFILVAILILIVVFRLIFRKPTQDFASTHTDDSSRITHDSTRINNKVISIEGVSYDLLKKALSNFKVLYKNEFVVVGIHRISNSAFVLVFPDDISFRLFSYLVNYLKYPNDIDSWNPQIMAWTTLYKGDEWVIEEMVNKQAMLYIADNDTEYDNVSLTTELSKGYILTFSKSKAKELKVPFKDYIAPQGIIPSEFDSDFEIIK